MKRKWLSVVLAVCLCVACLPLSAGAAQLTGSQKELEDFLGGWGYSCCYDSVYDSNRASSPIFLNGKFNILESFLTSPLVSQSLAYKFEPYFYPGEASKPFWETKDPLGRWPVRPASGYRKVNVERQRWILGNH